MTATNVSDEGEFYDVVSPRADALMESLRATGYSLPDAIADLIDNSLTAGARNVRLSFYWDGADSSVSLLDDGMGMNCSTLINAMRMGSQSPLDERDPTDLGRYGLGMKTASISQARSLTVASRVLDNDEINVRRWDLDHISSVKDWQLLKFATDVGITRLSVLDQMQHGTVVFLEKLDRIVENSPASDAVARRRFLEAVNEIEAHISMVFHRFMCGPKAVAFWINDQHVNAWDPFLTDEAATQRLSIESLSFGNSTIVVEPYVLPHHTRLTKEQHSIAGGPAG